MRRDGSGPFAGFPSISRPDLHRPRGGKAAMRFPAITDYRYPRIPQTPVKMRGSVSLNSGPPRACCQKHEGKHWPTACTAALNTAWTPDSRRPGTQRLRIGSALAGTLKSHAGATTAADHRSRERMDHLQSKSGSRFVNRIESSAGCSTDVTARQPIDRSAKCRWSYQVEWSP